MAASGIVIDWTISLGNLITGGLTVLGAVAGGISLYFALKNRIEVTSTKIDVASEMTDQKVQAAASKTDERIGVMGGRMINLENEIKELKEVVINQAVMQAEIAAQRARVDDLIKGADEFRHWCRDQVAEMQKVMYQRRT